MFRRLGFIKGELKMCQLPFLFQTRQTRPQPAKLVSTRWQKPNSTVQFIPNPTCRLVSELAVVVIALAMVVVVGWRGNRRHVVFNVVAALMFNNITSSSDQFHPRKSRRGSRIFRVGGGNSMRTPFSKSIGLYSSGTSGCMTGLFL